MSDCPDYLQYTKSHEWIRNDGGDVVTVGITDYAQSQLGDLVFVDLPEVDTEIHVGDEVAVVESVKTAADVYSPVAGEIIEINELLSESPDRINHDPYGDGWLYKVKIDADFENPELLSAEEYQEQIEE